ncbi:unnamed protein product [marine sediment metagenome]|uniref:Uncharacterized protein n=1 Tax=marine sediment metagenome TaxID=412755 RepID=X0UPD7_9ZZZZ
MASSGAQLMQQFQRPMSSACNAISANVERRLVEFSLHKFVGHPPEHFVWFHTYWFSSLVISKRLAKAYGPAQRGVQCQQSRPVLPYPGCDDVDDRTFSVPNLHILNASFELVLVEKSKRKPYILIFYGAVNAYDGYSHLLHQPIYHLV